MSLRTFAEALTNSLIGLCIALALTRYALPFWGYEPSIIESFEITALFFAAGFIRNLTIRELFRRVILPMLDRPTQIREGVE